MLKKIFLGLVTTFLMIQPAYAFDFSTRTDLKLDESLSDQGNTVYAYPSKIYIVPVSSADEDISSKPEEWIDAIYYYSITRLKFADVPYNYFLDENGNIYQGRKGYDGVVAEISDEAGVIVVGYLSSRSSLTNRAENSFLEMFDFFSSSYGITKDDVYVADLILHSDDESLSYVTAEVKDNTLSSTVKSLLSEKKSSGTENLDYKTKVSNVIYEKKVEIGNKLHVKLTVENLNNFVWFNTPDNIYVSTFNGDETVFAVNGIWDSFSKPTHLSKEYILPGESIDIEFDLQANALPGSQEIKFGLMKYSGELFENSSFTVKFEIEKGDNELAEVNSPDGFLNVRDCAGYGCEVVTTVDNGQVFVVLDTENEWAKIEYGEEEEGWVYKNYLDFL